MMETSFTLVEATPCWTALNYERELDEGLDVFDEWIRVYFLREVRRTLKKKNLRQKI